MTDSETIKSSIVGIVKERILTGMGQKKSREAGTGSGVGEVPPVTGDPTSSGSGITTVEINHGFVKTRTGLLMAVQVVF